MLSIPKLSDLYKHDDDIIVAIERWAREEAHVGFMANGDPQRIQRAGELLQERSQEAWCPGVCWCSTPVPQRDGIKCSFCEKPLRKVQRREYIAAHPKPSAAQISEKCQVDIDVDLQNQVKQMNEKFFVVEEYGGKCLVAWQEPDVLMNGRLKFEIQTFGNFVNRYNHKQVVVGLNAKGGTRTESKGKMWLDHPKRKQYLRVVFAPGETPVEFRDPHSDAMIFNLWHGFSVKPKEGDCSLFLDHLRRVICCDSQFLYDYLLNWMARAVQFPGERGHVALVFKGKKGSGKSLVVDYFGNLFGTHYLAISQGSQVTGNFNSHLRDLCVLACNEAFFAGDPRQVGPLKALITDPTIAIEQKFVDVINVPNTLHFMVTTNEDWSIPATADERRFCYFEVGAQKVGDIAYFKQLFHERDNGGYEALLDFLLKRDISKFEPRHFPKTEGLRRQMAQSLSPVQSAWFECLMSGAIPAEVLPNGTAQMRASVFIGWSAKANKRWVFGDEKVGNLLGVGKRQASSDSMGFQKERGKDKCRYWVIPTLVECRRLWNEKHFDYDWSLDADKETWESNVSVEMYEYF